MKKTGYVFEKNRLLIRIKAMTYLKRKPIFEINKKKKNLLCP